MSARARLSIMMFLQFFVWGAWFATLGKCLADKGLGDFGGGAYGSAPIAAIIGQWGRGRQAQWSVGDGDRTAYFRSRAPGSPA